ncbi:MAG: hypothetical protein RIS35_2649 [Pseudomonadota bacterium]|jgi:CheY-like chemotaxis protein
MRRALMIEDNPVFRHLIRLVLETDGFAVHEACDATGIVRLTRQVVPDVILMDLGLPGPRDGLDACAAIRALEEFQSTPIVVVSGFSEPIDRQRAFAAGAKAYLTKPFDPIELIGVIRRVVPRGRQRRLAADEPHR